MSSQLPPNPNVATFNSNYWNTTSTSLTQAEADTLYVKFPVSQPQAETFLGDVAVNGTLTFNEGFGTNFSVSETCGTRDLSGQSQKLKAPGLTATMVPVVAACWSRSRVICGLMMPPAVFSSILSGFTNTLNSVGCIPDRFIAYISIANID